MKINKPALKAAFPHTVPVLTGFIFLGIAYGILMNSKGYSVLWTVFFSLVAFAGSSQYVSITFLTTIFNPLNALLVALTVNARHLFYGLSMLDKYKDTGKIKPYLIFGLCDETFSIVCSAEPPVDIDRNMFVFYITFLNHMYWVIGSALGGILGSFITFNTDGLDFVLTALFVTIFTAQWKSQKDHRPAITGVVCSLICLKLFGNDSFIIPAMISILLVLTLSWIRSLNNNDSLKAKEDKIS
ncbi:MAG: branched-chain amino acid ABC transporter permease [Clostridia bacterium]|nr:branched-chain amino acid ABC transporter permease [Clostridia bacterium]